MYLYVDYIAVSIWYLSLTLVSADISPTTRETRKSMTWQAQILHNKTDRNPYIPQSGCIAEDEFSQCSTLHQ